MRAQNVCSVALEEMPNIFGLQAHLPGEFNPAARTLLQPVCGRRR